MDSSINITPTSSSSIRQQPSINSDRKKESFKQQFKRLVGWGSSYNVKKQGNALPPPLTISSHLNSPSDTSFASTPSTLFPPTPGTFSSVTPKPKHHPVNEIMELNTPVSIASKPSIVINSSATGLSSTVSLTTSSKILSNHSSLSTVSSTSSVTSEELAAAATNQHLDEDEGDDEVESEQPIAVKEEEAPVQVLVREEDPAQVEEIVAPIITEEGDIQTQYAMWMTTNAAVPEETIVVPETPISHSNNAAQNSAEPKPSLPPTTASSKSCKSSIISDSTIEFNTTLSMSSTTASTDEESKEQPDMHPMSSGQEVDDLFLLVAHGVEFLTSRENSKWEEYGGYEFHPWNRPQGSFSVRHRDQQRNKETSPLPQQLTSNESRPKIDTDSSSSSSSSSCINNSNSSSSSSQIEDITVTVEKEELEEVAIVSATPPSTPLPQEESPSALAKRILGAKPEIQVPLTQPQPQQHQSVDDDELQRIVAAHIVF